MELAIVLVILGLLVGGILAGKALIDASELRKISADFTRYESAVNAFRDKYFFYPGDLPNATQFWGAAGGSSSDNYTVTCYPTVNTDNTTCNGDGDGKHRLALAGGNGEDIRAWQHMSNSGLVEGAYAGNFVASSIYPYGFIAGQNLPAGPRQSVYTIGRVAHSPSAGVQFYNTNPSLISYVDEYITITVGVVGSTTGPASRISLYPFLNDQDAWNIDTKMDDGIAESGKLRGALRNYGPSVQVRQYNPDGSSYSTSLICTTYRLDVTAGPNCALAWRVTQ